MTKYSRLRRERKLQKEATFNETIQSETFSYIPKNLRDENKKK